jgi:steroid Delta-isomerase
MTLTYQFRAFVDGIAGTVPRSRVESVVKAYLSATSQNDVAARARLFAVAATLEDPVGSPPLRGREAIMRVFEGNRLFRVDTKLELLVINGNEAAYVFTASVVDAAGDRAEIRTIETLLLDNDSLIVSMRAHFDSHSIA